MIAAGFASFFTGITEPLEFSFMFVAPVLYVLHAVLTGISVYIAASMQWIAGFGFSAGLVDLVLSSKNPLANHLPMLLAQGVVFFGIYYTVFRFAISTFNLKTAGREDVEPLHGATNATVPVSAPATAPMPQTAEPAQSDSMAELAKAYIEVAGGADNLVHIDACITRLRLTVQDSERVNAATAKSIGASGVIKLNKENVQIVIGPKAELIADAMRKHLGGLD